MQTTDPTLDPAERPTAPATPPTPALETSPGFLGRSLLVALLVLVGINVAAFLVFYRDTLGSVAVPYAEDFSALTRLDYRQYGGTWKVVDAALVQSDASLPDLFAVLTPRLPEPAAGSIAATLRFTSENDGGGVLFGMEQPDDRRGSHLVRFGRGDDGVPYVVWGTFDQDLQFASQGSQPLPDLGETARLQVVFGPATYDVLVNDAPVAQAVPVLYHGGHLALTTWFSSVVFDDVQVDGAAPGTTGAVPADPAADPGEPAAPAQPDPTTAPAQPDAVIQPVAPVEPVATPGPQAVIDVAGQSLGHVDAFIDAFDGTGADAEWTVQVGEWTRRDSALVQGDASRYDLAIAHRATVSNASVKVHLTQVDGLGAGILFGLPQLDSLRGGHLVRFGEDGTLFWGAFDQDRVFTGQGYAPTNVKPGETHLLEVQLTGDTYAIALDGTVLAENVPLHTPEGHIGLTTSVTSATFEDVTVAPLTQQPGSTR